jgi:hypothetical protein
MNNSNELDPEFINDLDNVSLTETDGLSVRGKYDAHLAYAKTNAYILKKTFANYIDFDEDDEEIDEDDLIFMIQDYNNIDWEEVSMLPKLPEFIMEEFQNKLNWYTILTNRRMTVKTIKRFKTQLFHVTNRESFRNELNASNTHLLILLLIVNEKLLKRIFRDPMYYDISDEWESLLMKSFLITKDDISERCNRLPKN